MNGKFPLSTRYFATAMTYSAIRKISHVHKGEIETYDRRAGKTVHTPLLFTTKVGIVTSNAAYGCFIWPYYLLSDLEQFEIRMRGLDPELYDVVKPSTYVDYVLS